MSGVEQPVVLLDDPYAADPAHEERLLEVTRDSVALALEAHGR